MNDDVLIEADGVSKKYCRSLKRSMWYGLQDMASEVSGTFTPRKPLRQSEFWATRDVSFAVRRGECVGLIGRNGAGKTTLLKLLNGLIKPDAGVIRMRGHVGALIALGSGFNPVLTGRENIYVNAAVLGLRRSEVDRLIDSIIDFAEIGDAIDSAIHTYSSGMQVRLGFAVATALQPDVLLLDEVLAVGDERFQLKCFERLSAMLRNGVAGILVSHQLHNIERLCSRCIVMAEGQMALDTRDVKAALARYHELNDYDMPSAQIFAAPSSPVSIGEIAVDSQRGCVTFLLRRLPGAPEAVLVSYTVWLHGSPLLRATTRQSEKMLIPIHRDRICVTVPPELLRLGRLTLTVSLWACPEAPQPLAWARGIQVDSPGAAPYFLTVAGDGESA